jgi:dolichol kinase
MGWSRGTTIALLVGALIVQLAFDVVRLRSVQVNRTFFRLLSGLASPREARGVASSTWYTLGALVAFMLYPPSIAAGAILLLALADPAAAVAGRLVGGRPLGTGTLAGTATFWLVGSTVLLPFVGWPHAVFAALLAGLAEIVPGLVDDNLVIPVVAGAALALTGAPTMLGGFPF